MTSRPRKKKFSFLDLPSEIRNAIYEYALTEPEGLHYHHVGNELTASPDRKQYTQRNKWRGHANQLKFTCHQIYNETRGRGLQFNTLHFKYSDASHPFASEQVLQFLNDTSPYQLDRSRRALRSNPGPIRVDWIRHITLTHEPALEIAGWADNCCYPIGGGHTSDCPWIAGYRRTIELVKFAQLHPHIRFDSDISLPPHGYMSDVPGTERLVYEIIRHLFLFRGIALRYLPVDLERMDRHRPTRLLIANDDPATLIAPTDFHFHVPKEWVDEDSIDDDYHCCWRCSMRYDDYAFGQGLDALKADLNAWAENGF
jgi:hypothetical protein